MSDTQTINKLFAELDDCMLADRRGLSKRLHGLRRRVKQGKPVDRSLGGLAGEIEASVASRKLRADNIPAINYPEELPVSEKRAAISEAIAAHQVVIVAGETGSGKTTQLPKICLELGRGISGQIGHTQPRRIAARSVAGRIAQELGSRVGEHVGYKVRFSDQTKKAGYIKLMTDGILLAEIQSDPLLLAYDTIIIDEAHERSLNIDFLLGFLRQLLPKRPDLKLIITSATINTGRFSEFFDDAPVIEVSGRSYPVDIYYRPIQGDEDDRDRDLPQAIVDAVDEAGRLDPLGDILVFLPGEREIREAADALHQHAMKNTEVVPLLSRLSPAEQDRVFQSHTGRRIVLATNVAETSLTVPGIRFVIDSGLARISRYSARTKVQRLPVEAISQASANQRSGRCGRVAAGVCFRLYAEEDFNNRPPQTDPEIRRTNLASVILQMSSMGLGELSSFPFMDAPEKKAVRDGYLLLEELQAVDSNKKLTPIGRKLVRLPVDPRIGRMLLQADKERSLHELLIIASAMSVQEPRTRPMDMQQQADEKHRLFADPGSDFLAWLKLWNWYHEQARHLSRSRLRKLCHERFLSYIRLREWHDLHGQLLSIVREMNMTPNKEPASTDEIHRALLAGLLSHIGLYDPEKRNYLGARGIRFAIFPGSSLFKKPPSWVVCGELVETSRLYGRTAAAIDPAWLESLAPHLIKRSYSEVHWSRKRAQVAAYEKLVLYGLPMVGRRRMHYGPIEPEEARQTFIRHALVQFEYQTSGKFFAHNRRVISELEKLEAKSRRRDLLAEEQVCYDFFDALIPEGIYSGKLFEQWRKQAEQKHPKTLFLNQNDLLHGDTKPSSEDFPDYYRDGKLKLKYSYHFDPTHKADGVTLLVPLAALGQLDAACFQWLVPGMLVEKLTQLIRSLPKSVRRNFVPAPQFAQSAMEAMAFGEGELLESFARQLERMTGVKPHRDDWNPDALPAHLSMKFRITGDKGETLETGSDLRALQEKHAAGARQSLQAMGVVQELERTGITRWEDFGNLPESVNSVRGRLNVQLFPALHDDGQSVSIRVFESRHEAAQVMRKGLKRLLMLHLHQQVAMLKKNTPQLQQLAMRYALIGNTSTLKDELIEAAFDEVFLAEPWPRTQVEFTARLDQGRGRIVDQASKLANDVSAALAAYAELVTALDAVRAAQLKPVVEDIRQQMERLIYPGFVGRTSAHWLAHFSRFIEAAKIRLGKAGRSLAQDKQHTAALDQLWTQYTARREAMARAQQNMDAIDEFRWLMEELRVSLFAQELRTSTPVSLKKLEKLWQGLR